MVGVIPMGIDLTRMADLSKLSSITRNALYWSGDLRGKGRLLAVPPPKKN